MGSFGPASSSWVDAGRAVVRFAWQYLEQRSSSSHQASMAWRKAQMELLGCRVIFKRRWTSLCGPAWLHGPPGCGRRPCSPAYRGFIGLHADRRYLREVIDEAIAARGLTMAEAVERKAVPWEGLWQVDQPPDLLWPPAPAVWPGRELTPVLLRGVCSTYSITTSVGGDGLRPRLRRDQRRLPSASRPSLRSGAHVARLQKRGLRADRAGLAADGRNSSGTRN